MTPATGRARPTNPPAPGAARNNILTPPFKIMHRKGRRWIDEDEVTNYIGQVAAELARRDRYEAMLADELDRLKSALARWQRQHAPAATIDGYLGEGPPRPMRDTDAPHDIPWPPHG